MQVLGQQGATGICCYDSETSTNAFPGPLSSTVCVFTFICVSVCLPYGLRWSLSLNQRPEVPGGLTGQQMPGIRLSPPPSSGLPGTSRHTQLFMWVPGIQIQVLMLSKHSYPLIHLLSPTLRVLLLTLLFSVPKHRVFLGRRAAKSLTEERCVSDALHACLSCAGVVQEFKINESDMCVT